MVRTKFKFTLQEPPPKKKKKKEVRIGIASFIKKEEPHNISQKILELLVKCLGHEIKLLIWGPIEVKKLNKHQTPTLIYLEACNFPLFANTLSIVTLNNLAFSFTIFS